MGKLAVTTLRDKIKIKHGFAFKGELFSSEGDYVVLTPGNFHETGGFKFDPSKAKFYSGEIPSDYICNQGDLIVAMTEQAEGLLGSSAIVPEDNRFLHNQRIGLVTVDSNEIDKLFLYHLLNTKSVRRQLSSSSSGSKVKHTSPDRIYDVIVSLPSLPTQQKIAAVLSALDAKIELNQRINVELESMAKTLYDYWFVQFDFPNAKGKSYKTSGGKMVWNEELKREIPEGWEVGTLLDIADYMNGLPCQKFRPTGKGFLRVIKIKEMRDGLTENSELVRPDIPEKAIIENGDVLFSWSASLEVQIWSGGKGALNQHIFKVISEKYPKSFYFYQLINYLQHFKMMAENRKTTMGHITQDHLKQSRIVLPPKKLTEDLEKIIAPIFEKKINNEIEKQHLTELRDWLLPMLMNGQVKVN
ncbi:MAG: restriction endonuclease subunit S [Thermodesulfovibrionia bacterium]|nr:restriction endonuclease subunit S [Thermodesulfovibrionia bacterium]